MSDSLQSSNTPGISLRPNSGFGYSFRKPAETQPKSEPESNPISLRPQGMGFGMLGRASSMPQNSNSSASDLLTKSSSLGYLVSRSFQFLSSYSSFQTEFGAFYTHFNSQTYRKTKSHYTCCLFTRIFTPISQQHRHPR